MHEQQHLAVRPVKGRSKNAIRGRRGNLGRGQQGSGLVFLKAGTVINARL